MTALAKKAHLPDGDYSRYHEDVVRDLCSGDLADVTGMVDRGDATAAAVDGIRRALSEPSAAPAPPTSEVRSAAGRRYGDSKRRFIEMGLCEACADNLAQRYVERPSSRCGRLAKHALAGDSEAVKGLAEFPTYCTWKYN